MVYMVMNENTYVCILVFSVDGEKEVLCLRNGMAGQSTFACAAVTIYQHLLKLYLDILHRSCLSREIRVRNVYDPRDCAWPLHSLTSRCIEQRQCARAGGITTRGSEVKIVLGGRLLSYLSRPWICIYISNDCPHIKSSSSEFDRRGCCRRD